MENNGRIDEFLCNYVSKRNGIELSIFKIISGNLPKCICSVPDELGISEDWEPYGEFYVYFNSNHWEDGCRWREPAQAYIMDYKLKEKDISEYLPALDDLEVIRVG